MLQKSCLLLYKRNSRSEILAALSRSSIQGKFQEQPPTLSYFTMRLYTASSHKHEVFDLSIRPSIDFNYLQCRTKVSVRYLLFCVFIFSIPYLPPHYFIMQRTSLTIIDDNQSNNHELSSYQRELIVKIFIIDVNVFEMKKIFNFNKSTI